MKVIGRLIFSDMVFMEEIEKYEKMIKKNLNLIGFETIDDGEDILITVRTKEEFKIKE